MFGDVVKKLFKQQKLTYLEASLALNMSLSSLKRLLKSQNPTLFQLEAISELVHLKPDELVALCGLGRKNHLYLSLEQEEVLSQSRPLFALVAYLRQGLTLKEIQKRHNLDKGILWRCLYKLEDAKFLNNSDKSFKIY
jgi:transcriptional regulator with XRE-family HTH domain